MATPVRIISTDDHVLEPPHLWQARLPAKYKDIAPRVERLGLSAPRWRNGRLVVDEDTAGKPCDWWLYEDLRRPLPITYAAVGIPKDRLGEGGTTFEDVRRGCWDPAERLKDMDVNSVEASLCFPNVLPRFCGQTFLEAHDKELALLCVRAYNDWMHEEWAGPSGGRLIHCSIVPLWDSSLAAEEVRRNAARGGRAVTFTELPANLGLPSIHDADRYWDPFFSACEETGTVICLHIGSSSKFPVTSADAPHAVSGMLLSLNAMASMCDYLFSGLFERFPKLTIAYSEGQIGWIPYILERADRLWREQEMVVNRDLVPRPPSEYYYEHIYGCYISDAHGLASIDVVGEDNVTFETDYPHTDGTWPNTAEVARRELAHLTDVQREKILRLNAIKMLSLHPDREYPCPSEEVRPDAR